MEITGQNERLTAIRDRIQMLVQENHALSHANLQMESRQRELKQLLEIQKQTIKDLEEKNKLSRMGQALNDHDSNKDLKLKINEVIRDIDKALAMLGG
jgi:hypothetical protein